VRRRKGKRNRGIYREIFETRDPLAQFLCVTEWVTYYEYTVVDTKTFNDVCKLKISGLQGAGKLTPDTPGCGGPDYK